jgi:DNA-directed RNA polymerase subunit beta
MRAIGYSSDSEIKKAFGAVDDGEFSYIDATLKKDPTKNTEEALIDIYRKLRPEDAVSLENAKALIENIFFNFYSLYLPCLLTPTFQDLLQL